MIFYNFWTIEVLSYAYAITIIYLTIILIAFFALVIKKHLLRISITEVTKHGILNYFRRSYISATLLSVSIYILILTLFGYLYIKNLILLLIIIIVVPTIIGAFTATTVGVITGLYGGLIGMFFYSLAAADYQYYQNNFYLFFILNLLSWFGGWSGGVIIHGALVSTVGIDVFAAKGYKLSSITNNLTSTVQKTLQDVYEKHFGTVAVHQRLKKDLFYELGEAGACEYESVVILEKKVNRSLTLMKSLLTGKNSFEDYTTPSQIMDALFNLFASIRTEVIVKNPVIGNPTETYIILKSYFETPSIIYFSKHNEIILNALRNRITKRELIEDIQIIPITRENLKVYLTTFGPKTREYYVKITDEEDKRVSEKIMTLEASAEVYRVSDIVKSQLPTETLLTRFRRTMRLKMIVIMANTTFSVILSFILKPILEPIVG